MVQNIGGAIAGDYVCIGSLIQRYIAFYIRIFISKIITENKKKMKYFVIALMCAMCISSAFAQEYYNLNLRGKVVKRYQNEEGIILNVGDSLHMNFLEYAPDGNLYIDTDSTFIKVTSRFNKCVEFDATTIEELWNATILTNVIPEVYLKKGAQEELRTEMECDAIEYISMLTRNGLHYNDPAVYSYIYSLIAKIIPTELIDGRSTNINLLIVNDPTPDAYVYPNGTLIVNTGLLATIHTEEELVAVLCHEIAHYISDHSIININKAFARQKRAEFWAAIATGLTAVAEGVAATKSNYIPGLGTASVALLSAGIVSEVIDRLGMKFDEKQEFEADYMAQKALKILGYSPQALATALYRIDNESRKQKYHNRFFSTEKKSIIKERLMKCGTPLTESTNREFEIKMSMPITQTAIAKCETGRFREAIELIDINLRNGVAVTADFLVKANCILSLYDTPEQTNEALTLVTKAKAMSSDHIGVMKSEILVSLRMKDYTKTMTLLSEYTNFLNSAIVTMKDVSSGTLWLSHLDHYNIELEWAKSMQLRVSALQRNIPDL